jgi:4'-phosphopantetheinyl transferase
MAASTEQACARLLSEDEAARAMRFKFERHRREFLATRALQRIALSAFHPLPLCDWRFVSNAYGKPSAIPERGLRFNLSNSPGLVVCLVSEGAEVGVDVEPVERSPRMLEVASRVFSPRELKQLEALSAAEKLDRALCLWTLKEAYIKARGMGLALPLEKISFLFGRGGAIRLELEDEVGDRATRWRFCLIDRAEHRIALMVEAHAVPVFEMWQTRPLLTPGRPLDPGKVRWFPESSPAVA